MTISVGEWGVQTNESRARKIIVPVKTRPIIKARWRRARWTKPGGAGGVGGGTVGEAALVMAVSTRDMAASCLNAAAGVDQGVKDIDHEIDHHDDGREQQHDVFHHHQITVGNGIKDQLA